MNNNLNLDFCQHMAERLLHMSASTKSHPAFTNMTDWTSALALHGKQLLKHCASNGERYTSADDLAGAKAALRWVTENLEYLWDVA